MKIEQERATRRQVKRNGHKFYFTVTEFGIMFHAPNEGELKNQDEYSAVNTICRLVSKLRGSGMEWSDVVKQLEAGSMWNFTTWPWLIQQVIRDEGYV